MPTEFEKELQRQHRRKGGKLVPLLEDYFKRRSLEVEDEDDRKFLVKLLEERSKQRHDRRSYSPSQLGSCQRAVYFAKTGRKRSRVVDARANGFFAQGNFMHLKWQFALWKLFREGKINLIAVEPFVQNKSGDFSGHIDAIVEIGGVIYIVDFKGYQPRLYKMIAGGYVPEDVAIQLTGYMMIVSVGKTFNFKVDTGLLVVESKSGPDERGSPLGLVEVEIQKEAWKPQVNKLLKEQRGYEARKETPPPACTNVRSRGFQTCPWSGVCLEEVKAIQEREKASRGDPAGFRVAVPNGRGTSNSRKSRRRRS